MKNRKSRILRPARLTAALLLASLLLLGAVAPAAALADEDTTGVEGEPASSPVAPGDESDGEDAPGSGDTTGGEETTDGETTTPGEATPPGGDDTTPGDDETGGEGTQPGEGAEPTDPTEEAPPLNSPAQGEESLLGGFAINGLADTQEDEQLPDEKFYTALPNTQAEAEALVEHAPITDEAGLPAWIEQNLPKWRDGLAENLLPEGWGQEYLFHAPSARHYWRLYYLGGAFATGYHEVDSEAKLADALADPDDDINILVTGSFDISAVHVIPFGKTVTLTARSGATTITQTIDTPYSSVHFDVYGTLVMETLTLTSNGATYVGGVYVRGEFVMNSGTITGLVNTPAVYNVGTFTMNGGLLTKNHGQGAVYNKEIMVMNGGAITNNSAYSGGGIAVVGSATLTGGVLSGNHAEESGGAIYAGYSSLAIAGTEFKNNTAHDKGGALYIDSLTQPLSITGSTFTGNEAQNGSGGAIWARGPVTLSLGNTALTGNTASQGDGGALFATGFAALTLDTATIGGNGAGNHGGGIYAGNGGALTLTGTSITGNSAAQGGALHLLNVGETTITGGSISRNTASNGGGGIASHGGSSNTSPITIKDTAFQANESIVNSNGIHSGGGIFHNAAGALTLQNTNFTDNKAGSGGAVSSSGFHTLVVEGGTFTGNEASQAGGALYSAGNTSVTGAIFTGNTAGDAGLGGGLYINAESQNIAGVEISGNTFTGNKAGNGGGLGLSTIYTVPLAFNDNIFEENYSTGTGSGAGAYMLINTLSFYTSGSGSITGNTFTGNTFTANVSSGGNGGGLFLGGTWLPSYNAPYTVTLSGGGFYGNAAAEGGGLYVLKPLDVALEDGARLSDNEAENGGGLYLDTLSSATLTGATISGNGAEKQGGGLYLAANSSATLTDATIHGNSAATGGGLYITAGAGATLTGGSISENTAGSGAGLATGGHVATPTAITLNGTTLQDNVSQGVGGAILHDSSATLTLQNGALVTGNRADASGAGITARPRGGGSLQVLNSEVSDNHSTLWGGGIDIVGTLVLKDTTIAENTTGEYGGAGVQVQADFSQATAVEISGNTFRENKTSGYGGGLLVDIHNSLPFAFNNNTFTGNESTGDMGGGAWLSVNTSSTSLATPQPSYTFTGNAFTGNTAAGFYGGGLVFTAGPEAFPVTLSGGEFTGNTGPLGGGLAVAGPLHLTLQDGIQLSANDAEAGGGLYLDMDAEATLKDALLTGNTSGSHGGGVYMAPGTQLTVSGATLTHNTAAQNGGAIYTEDYESLTVTAAHFEENTAERHFPFDTQDAATKAVYEAQITQAGLSGLSAPSGLSAGTAASLQYAYNNLDINYLRGAHFVTFKPENGTADFSETVIVGQEVPEPQNITKIGHTLLYWQMDDGTPWVFTGTGAHLMPDGPLTLTALWLANEYPLVYDYNTNGNASQQVSGGNVEYGTSFAPPQAPVRPGYTFTGWYTERQNGVEWDFANGKMPAMALTLYAHWRQDDAPVVEPPAPSIPESTPSTPTSTPSTPTSAPSTPTSASSAPTSTSTTTSEEGESTTTTSRGGGGGGTAISTPVVPPVTPPASRASSATASTGASSGTASPVPASSTASPAQSAPVSTESASPAEGGEGNGGGEGGYQVNPDGSLTYTAPGGEVATLPAGTYTMLENGAVLDHNPESPYYVEDNGVLDILGNPVPLGGPFSRGGWGMLNLILALLALFGGLARLVSGLVRKTATRVLALGAMASSLLPLLAFLIFENKAQMLLLSRFTPLIAALFLLSLVLLVLSALRGKREQGEDSETTAT